MAGKETAGSRDAGEGKLGWTRKKIKETYQTQKLKRERIKGIKLLACLKLLAATCSGALAD